MIYSVGLSVCRIIGQQNIDTHSKNLLKISAWRGIVVLVYSLYVQGQLVGNTQKMILQKDTFVTLTVRTFIFLNIFLKLTLVNWSAQEEFVFNYKSTKAIFQPFGFVKSCTSKSCCWTKIFSVSPNSICNSRATELKKCEMFFIEQY